MTRRLFVAGNWKMNTSVPEGLDLAGALLQSIAGFDAVEIAVLPPFLHLWPMRQLLHGSSLQLGAQDVYCEECGAFTGEIAASMLEEWCPLVLVGHSERRHIIGESDELVARKHASARAHQLRVIFAVGETEAERDAGTAHAVVERQLQGIIACDAADTEGYVVAYEPVWAIGTGRTATPEQAQEMCAHIKDVLSAQGAQRDRLLVQYGGSVTASNAADLFAMPDIDGALVGGASLKVDAFTEIVRAAAAAPVG